MDQRPLSSPARSRFPNCTRFPNCAYGRYGDCLRSGWRNIMDCVVRLHKLSLLPSAVLLTEAEDPEAAAQRIPRVSNTHRVGSSGSLLSRAISRCASDAGAGEVGPGLRTGMLCSKVGFVRG
jgi:hypothetical protein